MKKKFLAVLVGLVIMLGTTGPVSAALVTSLPDGEIILMPSINYFGGDSQTVTSNITWSSTNQTNQGGSVFGYTGGYGFADNGYWDGSMVMAGLNDSMAAYSVSDSMTFEFDVPVKGVGGFINYAAPDHGQPVISIYDSAHNLIESATLDFTTGGGVNSGRFYGFLQSGNNIKYFTLTDAYIGITNLTVTSTPVPAALWLFASGFVGIAGLIRRKNRD